MISLKIILNTIITLFYLDRLDVDRCLIRVMDITSNKENLIKPTFTILRGYP